MNDNPGGGCLQTLFWLAIAGLVLSFVIGFINGPQYTCWTGTFWTGKVNEQQTHEAPYSHYHCEKA